MGSPFSGTLISSTHKIYLLSERLGDTIDRRMFPVLHLVISPDLQIIKSKDEDRDPVRRRSLWYDRANAGVAA
jgi:hypothetical protein